MKKPEINVWKVTHPYNEQQSGVTAYFTSARDANLCADEPIGWYNQRGHVTKLSPMTYSSFEEWKSKYDADERKKAISKLSEREKKILGL